jgi:hypothetical protein
VFAGMLLGIGGVLNVIYGIAAIGNSKFFTENATYILSNLNTWGWIALVIGVLQLFAVVGSGSSRPLSARSRRCCRSRRIRSGRCASLHSRSSCCTSWPGRPRPPDASGLREPFAALQAALLGLVGLVLAFGLAMAVGRYETRRAAVVEDANAIGTTYLRAQTLGEPLRTGSLERPEAYLDNQPPAVVVRPPQRRGEPSGRRW